METIEQLVNLALSLRAEKQQCEEALAVTNEKIAQLLPTGGTVGDHRVNVTRRKTLNIKQLEKAYPVAKFAHLYEPKLSTSAVKNAFSPTQLERFKTESSTPTVTIR
ncbi:hypothetical protein [Actinotignum urinale]|uniref:hypothetical protein n=1 Tax=Actinotignum urinale TaxID=190146 RepID=UPI0003B3660B|nr:hypothetical protein [Actinotignum urinale]MDY5159549.1 hypothetical protein [Actinotignum urinale]